MGHYTVAWQDGPNSALDDAKEYPGRIRRELIRLSKVVLLDQPSADPSLDGVTQRVSSDLLLRQAITDEDFRRLAALDDGDLSTPETTPYWFLYRTLNPIEVFRYGGTGFLVCRIVPDEGLAYLYEQIQNG